MPFTSEPAFPLRSAGVMRPRDLRHPTRREVLRAGGGLALGAALGLGYDLNSLARSAPIRSPGSLPDPSRPAGTVDESLPFDHIVIVMQENHSFDDYLGMLPRRGQPLADGFTFNAHGVPINSNPYRNGYVTVQHAPSDCTLNDSGSQSWTDTHRQIDHGRMDGFAETGLGSLGYWDETDIPFYYSLARTFCLANRWFCSAPCQTYPNRRFLQAGTAFGLISTDTSSIGEYPPNGTIWDRLHQLGISWANYFSDLPTTGIIDETIEKYPANIIPISRFYTDCAAGTLPAVSMVDSDEGAVTEFSGLGPALGAIPGYPEGFQPGNVDQDEESGNISEGENFVGGVVEAVMNSPSWRRILLLWTYDEHGGNYDHVPPPAAIPPDNIPPKLSPGDPPGGYNIYGPRVPAVVMSAYSRPNAVTNVVHDHTSFLATIEAKWNVPALTYRDANAATMVDFLVSDGKMSYPDPPELAVPSNLTTTTERCDPGPLQFAVHPSPPGTPTVKLSVRREHRSAHAVTVELHAVHGTLTDVELELEHRHRVLARHHLARLGSHKVRVVLHHRPLHAGSYTIIVRSHGRVVLAHHQRLTRAEI